MDVNDLKTVTDNATANIYNMPVGTVVPYMGLAENLIALRAQGWIPCDGTAYLHTEFPLLHIAIGNSSGGDTSKFNVPDLRGVFLRGVDRAENPRDPDSGTREAQHSGGLAGNNVGSYQGDEFKSHIHSTNVFVPDPGWRVVGDSGKWPPPNFERPVVSDSKGGNETRPKNVAAYYIIFAGLPA